MAITSKRTYGTPRSATLALRQATADPCLCMRHSNTQRQVWLSLCGVSWHAQGFVWALQVSLVGMRFDSKCDFAPPTILLRLLCPCKSRKSRDTWNNRQIWPCKTKWSRAKTKNRVFPRESTGHSKHPLPTTREWTLHLVDHHQMVNTEMDITRLSILKSDWLHSLQPEMEKLYTVSKNKTKSWLWLRSWTP